MSTFADRPLVAHRYVDARTVKPGQVIVCDLGRIEFTEWRPAPANPARGAITVCGLRNGQPVEFVMLPAKFYNYPRATVEDECTEREVEQIENFAEGLMSGRVFSSSATSARSVIGYEPPSTSASYAKAVAALAKGIGSSDRQAKLAAAALRVLAPCAQTPSQAVARMYEAVAAELAAGFFDTIGNAGPEAGRRRDHQHEYTMCDRLQILVTLTVAAAAYPSGGLPSVGWCAAALCRREGIRVPDFG